HQRAIAGLRDIDGPVACDGNALASTSHCGIDRIWIGDEEADLPAARSAYPDAPFHLRIHIGDIRLRIGGIQIVVSIERDSARPSKLLPLRDEGALLIEDLHTAVSTVRDEKPPLRIEHEAVRRVELTRAGTLVSPCLDELSVPVELDDARIGVAAGLVRGEREGRAARRGAAVGA